MPRRSDRKLARRLGRRIQELRRQAGITQESLAWSIEIDKGYMSQLESGLRLPSLPVLCDIAAELDVEPADLLAFDLRHPRLLLLDAARRHDVRAVRRALGRLGLS